MGTISLHDLYNLSKNIIWFYKRLSFSQEISLIVSWPSLCKAFYIENCFPLKNHNSKIKIKSLFSMQFITRRKGGIVIIHMAVVIRVIIIAVVALEVKINLINDKIRIRTKIKKIMKMKIMTRKVFFYILVIHL